MATLSNYYITVTGAQWNEFYEQKQKVLEEKKALLEKSILVKPKLMEFNVKAKGWKPPATKTYIKTAFMIKKYKEQHPILPAKVVGQDNFIYVINEDEGGLYWTQG